MTELKRVIIQALIKGVLFISVMSYIIISSATVKYLYSEGIITTSSQAFLIFFGIAGYTFMAGVVLIEFERWLIYERSEDKNTM